MHEQPENRADAPLAELEKARPADWRAGGFAVYVHWPFCQAKCPYCDFNSHVWRTVDQSQWRDALISELAAAYRETPDRTVDTVFFGGGTPSLMEPQTVAAIIEAIDGDWGLAPGAEITLEANPTSVEAERFQGYASAGVSRISMGVQALNDADLHALGRLHSVSEARAAFDVARSRFDRVSFDMIYARPGQTPGHWRAELSEALSMAVDHLSLYQLTIEAGTRFGDLYDRGRLVLPPDEASVEMYVITQELCAAAGMPAYEVSNHAAVGAECRHNLVYWRYGDYVGVGPGAHGRLTTQDGRRATETLRDPAAWIAMVEDAGAGWSSWAPLAAEDQAIEMLLMGMRLSEGIDAARFERLSGRPLDAERIAALVADGFVDQAGDRLKTTMKGRPVLNAVLRELLT